MPRRIAAICRPRARLPVLALAAAAVLLATAPALVPGHSVARGADAVTLNARALVGGRFAQGGWLEIAVSLQNDGPPVSGRVVATGTNGEVRRSVDLPAGARKVVPLYVHPEAFVRTVTVRLLDGSGNRLASGDARVQVLESGVSQVAVVGDASGVLRTQLVGRASGLPEPITMSAGDVPERPEPLSGLRAIVWAGDSGSLSEPQRRALQTWVAAGGDLIVLGGPDWQSRTAAFGDLLPVADLRSRDAVALATLAQLAGGDELPTPATATVATGTLRSGAISLAELPNGGASLLSAISRGSGRVVFVGADLAADPLRAWQGSPLLFGRLVPDDRAIGQLGGFVSPDNTASLLAQALTNIPALEVPPVELLLLVIVGYILLIGPVSYIVLRRRDRRDLAWLTAPLLVLVFSAGTYGIGWSLKGSQVIVNELALVRATGGGDAASVQTYAGVFSPTRATYDLTVHADALVSVVQSSGLELSSGSSQAAASTTEQGDPAHLRGLAVSVFGLQALEADAIVAYQPDLEIEWRLEGAAVAGTVRNRSDHPVEDVAVISQGSGVMVGTLQPGAQKDFRLTAAGFAGQPVSDQVYGSFGVQTDTPDQRAVAMRRQVIDALMGYGGKFPVMGGGVRIGGVSGASGPLVLGWRRDVSPVAVDVDGTTFQHYRQSVEVLGGRPSVASGDVTLGATSLTVAVVSTSGDANQQVPGGVFMSTGEAVYRIGLPLEASRLQPTELRLIAGQDPSVVYSTLGSPGGFPPGFRMAIFRPGTNDWEDLGELGAAGQFIVKDPASAVAPGGTILVKVTAEAAAKGGSAQVFVGASVRGVLP